MSAERDDVVLRPASPGEQAPMSEPRGDQAPLLDDALAERFAQRWSDVQARFVDDPKTAVNDADALVTDLLQALAAQFGVHVRGLEQQWQRGGEPRTEDLRLALQSYRSLFQRLLHT